MGNFVETDVRRLVKTAQFLLNAVQWLKEVCESESDYYTAADLKDAVKELIDERREFNRALRYLLADFKDDEN